MYNIYHVNFLNYLCHFFKPFICIKCYLSGIKFEDETVMIENIVRTYQRF